MKELWRILEFYLFFIENYINIVWGFVALSTRYEFLNGDFVSSAFFVPRTSGRVHCRSPPVQLIF